MEEAGNEDLAEIHTVLVRAFESYMQRLGRAPAPGAYERLAAAVGRGDVHVLRLDGRIVGAMKYQLDEDNRLTLDALAVDPEYQGRGIAREMLAGLDVLARKRGICAVRLCTAEMMDHLIRFYRSAGYEIYQRAIPDHGLDSHSRVFMEKRLD